ncbi:MAG: response regulator transcription factor [Gammaproteobacteria bacterium]|nr:response regulator transcription factor [Gammaproteobacteria bacterium]
MRLLLVEDDTALINQLKPTLVKAGYTVDCAQDGLEAEQMGNEGIYDIVVLDLGLPLRNGIEVLTNWRHQQNSIPVIILTARDAWHERVDGFNAGADDYLGKPFHAEELLARINSLIHRSKQQAPGKLVIDQIQLDEANQSVTNQQGEHHKLTGTEFRLLRYFLLHPEKVLSKTTLMDKIYDMDSDKDSNVIEVYIKRLRSIIGKPRIETRRGQGYIFRKNI